ncbi:MAG TPA: Gfo/Idh/MocA family oxidoreductase [Pedobacter sp.]|uniref:Gfo/Idh/MocA family protein n=1 Tax=Pedobacter sp. TaxID=1411316 RepID=UPI002CB84C74|nr:Gfo/Idh/MocA family oxidoreductase [Pedobacter sp.]HMI01196.1 Gfo/Idh/MocA family oxidoreductase [Pedobacter sp.]
MKRREFLSAAGIGAAAFTAAPYLAFAGIPLSDRKIRVAIVGGGFGAGFYFHEHPNCIVEAVSDLRKDRRDKLMQIYKCQKSYESLEKLLKDPKVEAVFIATPAIDHAKHVIETLKAGKHVLCAVPAAMTLEECDKIRDAVERTGLTYMMAETTAYRQNTISAKKFYKAGEFGHIFSAAAEYNHPGLESYFFENGKPTWRHGLPPMLYPTHCTSFLISVTGERLTSVSCLGWGDDSPLLKNNPYQNPFWNETAFFQTNKHTPFRVEVNWKGALKEAERGEWRGSKMSFYSPQQGVEDNVIVRTADTLGKDDAGFKNKANTVEVYKQSNWWDTDMLPQPLHHNSGHGGSHTFITHEFIDALVKSRQPEVNIYEALAYTAPGIVAHASALKNGEYMKIPSFDK